MTGDHWQKPVPQLLMASLTGTGPGKKEKAGTAGTASGGYVVGTRTSGVSALINNKV